MMIARQSLFLILNTLSLLKSRYGFCSFVPNDVCHSKDDEDLLRNS
jgi:hypothetical protein